MFNVKQECSMLSINLDGCSATAGGKETGAGSDSSGVKRGKSSHTVLFYPLVLTTRLAVLPVSTDNRWCYFTR